MDKIHATVTRASILRAQPCSDGYGRFLAFFGHLDVEEPIPLLDCLQSNDVLEVFWALRAVNQDIRAALPLLAADIAEAVLPLFEWHRPGDDRPRRAIEAARSGGGGGDAYDAADAAYDAALAAFDAVDASASAADAADAAARAADARAAYSADVAYDATASAATYAAYAARADAASAANALADILKKYFI